MKIAELRAKSKEELHALVTDLKKERFNLRMQEATGALENRSRFRETRLDIARAMTLINETPISSGEGRSPGKPRLKSSSKKDSKKEK